MLRGNIPARVDEKGRLKIPAAFLEELKAFGEQFYVTSETGDYARIFPMKIWEELESKLARLSSHNRTKQKFLTWTNYYGQAVEVDSQGRILIPPKLREYARFDRDVTFNALIDNFQLWDKAVLQRIVEAAAEQMADPEFVAKLNL